MSVYFSALNRPDLWNPSSDVARAFLEQAESVARMLRVECGVGEIRSDEVVILVPEFANFGEAFVARWLATVDESAMHALLGGCFSIVLGLHRALGMLLPSDDPRINLYLETGRRWVQL